MPKILIFVNMFLKTGNFNFQESYNKSVEKKKGKIMQVGGINNNYQTNFTGIEIIGGPQSKKRVIETLQNMDVKDVLKFVQVARREANNEVPMLLEDIGYHTGQKMSGVWKVIVGNKTYENANPMNIRSYFESNGDLMKRVSKNAQKLNPFKKSKVERNIAKQEDKLELMQLKNNIKKGANMEEIRNSLIDEFQKILQGRIIYFN